MNPLWKVKGFEKQTSWTVSVLDCGFYVKMSKKSGADIYIYMSMHIVILRVCATPHTTPHTNTHNQTHQQNTNISLTHTLHTTHTERREDESEEKRK